jgi:hypothetical protein
MIHQSNAKILHLFIGTGSTCDRYCGTRQPLASQAAEFSGATSQMVFGVFVFSGVDRETANMVADYPLEEQQCW